MKNLLTFLLGGAAVVAASSMAKKKSSRLIYEKFSDGSGGFYTNKMAKGGGVEENLKWGELIDAEGKKVTIFEPIKSVERLYKGKSFGSIELLRYPNYAGKGELYKLRSPFFANGTENFKSKEEALAKFDKYVQLSKEDNFEIQDIFAKGGGVGEYGTWKVTFQDDTEDMLSWSEYTYANSEQQAISRSAQSLNRKYPKYDFSKMKVVGVEESDKF